MAQSKFQALLEEFPAGGGGRADVPILLLRGYAYAALKRTDDALQTFNAAAALDPKDAHALAGIARIKLDQGKLEEAEADLKRALEVNPKSAEALSLWGEVYRRRGDADRALEYYNRALAEDARNRTALTGRAGLRLDRSELDKADADIKTLLAASPRNPMAHYLRALSQARHDDANGALATLQKQDALNQFAPAIYLQSVLQYRQNQLEQAVAGLERYLAMVPADGRARKLLATAYQRTA